MRLRPLFVPPAPRTRRIGPLAPVAIAVLLAVVGHEVSAPDAAPASVRSTALGFGVAEGVDLPDFSPVRRVVDGGAGTRASVARKQPKKKAPKRASRSRARKAIARPAWVRPSGGPLTSRYGMRWGRMHRGLDFGAAYGSPIYAASSGVVSFAGAQGGYGRLVTIRHAGGVTTAYGHMSRIAVRQGQRVKAGQVIAYVGSAGRSTGPHLHFEVRVGSSYLNPLPFLRARHVWV